MVKIFELIKNYLFRNFKPIKIGFAASVITIIWFAGEKTSTFDKFGLKKAVVYPVTLICLVTLFFIPFIVRRFSYYFKKIIRFKPNPYWSRFEKIKSERKLTYGYVEYKPFFWLDHSRHKGIGCELLKKVFSKLDEFKLTPYEYPIKIQGNWSNIFNDLCVKDKKTEKHKFDIIMTPLFETRSRLYAHDVLYCTPIFYSNIGLYVKESSYEKKTTLTFDESIRYLKDRIENDHWKAEFIPGELSQSLSEKHGLCNKKTNNTNHQSTSEQDFVRVLENVNDHNRNHGDFVFMEVFKAEMIFKGVLYFKLVNILKDHQLLYPVSFVVRKEETILKNLINIRLMEMHQSGELNDILKAEAEEANIKPDNFEKIFVQEYDFEKLEA